jgi:ubiquinone/menaquinone biosynthesis C-methylase UbiE
MADGRRMNTVTPEHAVSRDAFSQWVFQQTTAALEMLTVYIGERLGLYRELADGRPASAAELAARIGLDQRYVREWMEQQAVAGVLELAVDNADPDARTFVLPAGHAEVLLDRDSLAYLGPCARAVPANSGVLSLLLDAFGSGAGVPFAAYGAELRHMVGDLNRPIYVHSLASEWIAAAPDLDARLKAEPPARIADVGCGMGWSSLSLARAFPLVTVHGIDLDPASIDEAREHLLGTGLSSRVSFACQDAAHPDLAGSFELVTAFETVHDMAHPVEALKAMRGMLAEGGAVLVADERVADEFHAPGDELERWYYAWSVLHCLPAGRDDKDSAATGTMLRQSTLRRYAQEAGFGEVTVLPIDNEFWRIYLLRP